MFGYGVTHMVSALKFSIFRHEFFPEKILRSPFDFLFTYVIVIIFYQRKTFALKKLTCKKIEEDFYNVKFSLTSFVVINNPVFRVRFSKSYNWFHPTQFHLFFHCNYILLMGQITTWEIVMLYSYIKKGISSTGQYLKAL